MCIFQNTELFAGKARLSTWIHRIPVNSALIKFRKQSRRDEVSIDQLLPAFDGQGKLRHAHLSRWKNPDAVTSLVLRRGLGPKTGLTEPSELAMSSRGSAISTA